MTNPPSRNAAAPIRIEQTVERARAAWTAGRADEAEMACRQVLAVWPGQTDATYLLGLIAYAYGNLDLAVAHMREACRSPRAPAGYFSDLAEMCRQKGLLAEGEEAGRRAVALAPHLAAAWNNLGILLQEMLKLDESRLCVERALALEPNNAETLNNLANTFKRLGLAAEAEKRWNAALALKPNYAEAYSNLSNLVNDQGEYERAEEMARRAIDLNPSLADAYVNLAAAHTVRHRHADALRVLDALLGFAPGHARSLAARALALKELDRLDEALDAAKRAALAAPEGPEAHNAIGQVLQAMGQFEPALAAYDRAAALPGPAQMDAVANRGALFMEFGRKAEAAKAMEEAARAFPHAPGILFSQTDLKRFEPGDPLIVQMQALLSREGISLSDRATPHFRPRQGLSDIADSEKAFPPLRRRKPAQALDLFPTMRKLNERRMASMASRIFTTTVLAAKANMGARSRPACVCRRHAALRHNVGNRADPRLASDGPRRRRASSGFQTLVDGIGGFPTPQSRICPLRKL